MVTSIKYTLILFVLLPFFAKAQIINTFAGGGSSGVWNWNSAISVIIPDPISVAFDKTGNCYVASGLGGNRIGRIDTLGFISIFAGNGTGGYSGDGYAATNAELYIPRAVAFDSFGNVYIADGGNNVIRKVDITTNIISTFAGIGTAGYNGDSISATSAMLNNPNDICFDKFGNLFVADQENNRVRKINASGIITTVAGNGIYGYSGDNGQATNAQVWLPWSLAIDDTGNLYISDLGNFRIRKVNTSGIITTFAGSSTNIYSGDGISATDAGFYPTQIKLNVSNELFIGDFDQNFRVLMVDTLGIIYSVAGNGIAGFSGDNGPATAAEFDYPGGLAFDHCGNLYITDIDPGRVRKVTYDSTCDPYQGLLSSKSVVNQQNKVKISPNPATTEIKIAGAKGGESYALFSITGILEQTGILNSGSNNISLKWLAPGIYIVRIRDGDGQETVRRVVKW